MPNGNLDWISSYQKMQWKIHVYWTNQIYQSNTIKHPILYDHVNHYVHWGSLNLEPHASAVGDEPGVKPALRNLETQTTIPLGHVDSPDIDAALDLKYNQPLFKCLFDTVGDSEVDIEKLILPTYHWLDTRVDRMDIDKVDPSMRRACAQAVVLKDLTTVKATLVKEKEQERAMALAKIDTAADAMIAQQRDKVEKMGTTNVDESPLFKVNKNNIIVWKGRKTQLLDKAFQCVMDESAAAENDLRQHVLSMIESAYAKWSEHFYAEPDVGVDPELFGELEALMESSPRASWLKTILFTILYMYVLNHVNTSTHFHIHMAPGQLQASAAPTPDLGNQRLDDNEEVLKRGGLEDMNHQGNILYI